jgi:hypothetical protein
MVNDKLNRWRRGLCLTLCLPLAFGAAALTRQASQAQESATRGRPFCASTEVLRGRKWGLVVANGKPVMGVPGGAGGYSVVKRAEIIAGRLCDLYAAHTDFRDENSYGVRKQNGEIVLAVRRGKSSDLVEVITVDATIQTLLRKEDNKPQLSREEIAAWWGRMLRKAWLPGQRGLERVDPNGWGHVSAGGATGEKAGTGSDSNSGSQ